MEPYIYKAFISRVIDGDTYIAKVELGFNLTLKCRIRLSGVNTPEVRGDEKELGMPIADHVRNLIEGQWVILKSTNKADSFGRWLGEIIFLNEGETVNLGEALLEEEMGEVMALNVEENFEVKEKTQKKLTVRRTVSYIEPSSFTVQW